MGISAAAARWVGGLEGAWVVPQFFAAPVLGMLSDRFGRRPVIIVSLFGVGRRGGDGGAGAAQHPWWLFAARILCGLTCGGMAAAMAYVADVTAPDDRTRAYARINAAIWAAIVLGPALGGLLAGLERPAQRRSGQRRSSRSRPESYGLLVLPEFWSSRRDPKPLLRLVEGPSVGRAQPLPAPSGPDRAGSDPAFAALRLLRQSERAGALHRLPLRLERPRLRAVLQRTRARQYRRPDRARGAHRHGGSASAARSSPA